jgi:hypothetical protein
MRKVALVLVLSFVAAGGALAANPSLSAGGGGMNVVSSDRTVIWSEPANLDGLIASSEVIGMVGLETELANDFYFTSDQTIGLARWWGGYYNNNGCSDIGYATNWNLRFYNDSGCMPNNIIAEYPNAFANETSVYCQGGLYPIFVYEVGNINVYCAANTLYWFGVQAADHTFPPQCGRLASAGVVGCDTAFKSAYFSYPDWTPAIDVFGFSFDASQEFDNIAEIDWGPGACCFEDGQCASLRWDECWMCGGNYQGNDVPCDPNPCVPSPTKSTTWGRVKGDYR